jgi:hypothetical protein
LAIGSVERSGRSQEARVSDTTVDALGDDDALAIAWSPSIESIGTDRLTDD